MTYRYRQRRRRWSRRTEPAAVLVVTEDDPLFLRAAAALGHALWRYRSELAPCTTALAVALCAAWTHHRNPRWAIALTILTTAVTAALAVRPERWPAGRWAARWPIMARPAERLYAACVVRLAGAWLSAATWWGPRTPPLPTLAVLGTLAAGVPWWIDRRRRARVRVARIIDRWPTFAEVIGLPGSRVLSATVDRWGWSARLAVRRGQTARHVVNAAGAIESALSVRPGAVRIEPDPHRADRAVLRVIEDDPHVRPIPWTSPAEGRSVADPIELGVFEDGSPVLVRPLYRNVLLGGIVGSGKSGVLNVLLAALVGSPDVVIWGIDLKGGMELQPWAACLDRLVTTAADAVALFRAALAEVDRRARLLTAAGARLWTPIPTDPALIVVIDEYAELPADAHELADSVARLGRATAVNLLAATQRPTQKAMGAGAVRQQMDVRICLRVRERRDAELILSQGAWAAGWHPETLDAPGKFLISDPEHTTPRPARAYLVTDKDVARTAGRHASHRPTLPHAASHPEPVNETRGEPAEPHPASVVWDKLVTAGDDGVSVKALMDATGKGRTWVYDRLRELAATGEATPIARPRGHWRPVHHPSRTGHET